jgi:SPOR domain
LGDIDTEKALVNGKTYTRVMLSDFDSYSEAASTLKKVKDRSLADAFIVKYEDGKRTNKSR